jgi:hypothetical protein
LSVPAAGRTRSGITCSANILHRQPVELTATHLTELDLPFVDNRLACGGRAIRTPGGDRDGGIRHGLHDDDGLPAQGRVFLLLARRKEGVEIEEQPLHRVFGC